MAYQAASAAMRGGGRPAPAARPHPLGPVRCAAARGSTATACASGSTTRNGPTASAQVMVWLSLTAPSVRWVGQACGGLRTRRLICVRSQPVGGCGRMPHMRARRRLSHAAVAPQGAWSLLQLERSRSAGYACGMLALPRHRAPLRRLLALALFAWLMLVLTPVGAWAHDPGAPHADTPAAHAAQMHGDGAGCCADPTTPPPTGAAHACPCALPCSGMLAPALSGVAWLGAISTRYAQPPQPAAPLSGHAPPLRPPLS